MHDPTNDIRGTMSIRGNKSLGVKTGGYERIVAHPVSYPNVFKTDSGSDTDS
jgi:hypothetical protein